MQKFFFIFSKKRPGTANTVESVSDLLEDLASEYAFINVLIMTMMLMIDLDIVVIDDDVDDIDNEDGKYNRISEMLCRKINVQF